MISLQPAKRNSNVRRGRGLGYRYVAGCLESDGRLVFGQAERWWGATEPLFAKASTSDTDADRSTPVTSLKLEQGCGGSAPPGSCEAPAATDGRACRKRRTGGEELSAIEAALATPLKQKQLGQSAMYAAGWSYRKDHATLIALQEGYLQDPSEAAAELIVEATVALQRSAATEAEYFRGNVSLFIKGGTPAEAFQGCEAGFALDVYFNVYADPEKYGADGPKCQNIEQAPVPEGEGWLRSVCCSQVQPSQTVPFTGSPGLKWAELLLELDAGPGLSVLPLSHPLLPREGIASSGIGPIHFLDMALKDANDFNEKHGIEVVAEIATTITTTSLTPPASTSSSTKTVSAAIIDTTSLHNDPSTISASPAIVDTTSSVTQSSTTSSSSSSSSSGNDSGSGSGWNGYYSSGYDPCADGSSGSGGSGRRQRRDDSGNRSSSGSGPYYGSSFGSGTYYDPCVKQSGSGSLSSDDVDYYYYESFGQTAASDAAIECSELLSFFKAVRNTAANGYVRDPNFCTSNLPVTPFHKSVPSLGLTLNSGA